MIADSDALKYGALGFSFLVMLAVLGMVIRPIIRSFVAELQANREERIEQRKERSEQRDQFLAFMQNHAAEQIEAMHEVQKGLSEITVTLRRLNGHAEPEA